MVQSPPKEQLRIGLARKAREEVFGKLDFHDGAVTEAAEIVDAVANFEADGPGFAVVMATGDFADEDVVGEDDFHGQAEGYLGVGEDAEAAIGDVGDAGVEFREIGSRIEGAEKAALADRSPRVTPAVDHNQYDRVL